MSRIYKYTLDCNEPNNCSKLDLPVNINPISVQMQDGQIRMWAEVPTHVECEQKVQRIIQAIGTGWEVPKDSKYLGTIQDQEFVWHIYMLPLTPEQRAALFIDHEPLDGR